MARFEFNQKTFMDEVFSFIEKNDLTIRAFCAKAKCSPATIYRARENAETKPMRLQTIKQLQRAMDTYFSEALV